MKKQIDKIIELHSIGSNCDTNATKTIMHYYGYHYDEDVVFGLGSGLGFIYQYYSKNNTFFLSGKNESLELNVATLFGGTLYSRSFESAEEAWLEAKDMIDADIPLILDLSITHLPYFQPYLSEIQNLGFGLHNAMLVGYDDKEQTVTLLDHRWLRPQMISKQALLDSWYLKDSDVNPRGAFHAIMLPAPPEQINDEIRYALRLNMSRLLHPFAYKMGLPGLKTFWREISGFANIGLDDDSREGVATFASLMEKLGTGGGNFRRLYGNFLKKLSRFDDAFLPLRDTSKRYLQCAVLWKQLSINMTRWSDTDDAEAAANACTILEQIVQNEYACVEEIRAFLT